MSSRSIIAALIGRSWSTMIASHFSQPAESPAHAARWPSRTSSALGIGPPNLLLFDAQQFADGLLPTGPRGQHGGEDADDDGRGHEEQHRPRNRGTRRDAEAVRERPPRDSSEGETEREADERDGERERDALADEHPTDAPSRHPERAQHTELAGAVPHGDGERVGEQDGPEDRREHGTQRGQRSDA